jgi:RimJ/RimL family protein N-acetyltransferase
MKTITLRPVDLERDLAPLAELFTAEQNEPTTESSLRADHEAHKERILRLMIAEDESGELLGFNWMTRSRTDPKQAYLYVIVKPEHRGQGGGRRLYSDLELAAASAQVTQLHVTVRDDCPKCRSFADRNGFSEQRHSIGMTLNLTAFDDRSYEAVIERLQAEGFQFTSMEAQGNTEAAQRKLYALNDMTSSETPGSEGVHAWLDFEDFQRSVCGADWYKPAGQMVVIDTAGGEWVGMSAITRFEGANYAYNLHTGVDKRYRGRKLAQAVKVLALRYARDVLKVGEVRTNHNSQNDPMLTIDRKFGYVQTPGSFAMVKKIG